MEELMDSAIPGGPAAADAGRLIDVLDEAIVFFDQRLLCTRANPAAERLFGGDLPGQPASHFSLQCDGNPVETELARALQACRPVRFEYFCVARQRQLEVSAMATRGGGLAACFRDISARRRSAAMFALQQEAQALRLRRAGLADLLALLASAAQAQFADGCEVEFLVSPAAGEPPRHIGLEQRLPEELRESVERHLARGEALFGDVGSDGAPGPVIRIADERSWAALRPQADAHELHAVWAVPLVAPTQGVGRMALYYRGAARPPKAEDRDLEFAEFVAGIASLAIERAHDGAQQSRTEALLRDEVRVSETLNGISRVLATELELETIVQAVTDGATSLTRAQFGAFFYNTTDAQGATMLLYSLSGAARESFSRFPLPRPTAIFAHTFGGHGVLRFDDVTADSRYGQSAPFHGMPAGHLPVRSYLAMPVISANSGQVLGGIFLGHGESGVFTERHEKLIVGVAAQAAIAIDNARLIGSLRESADRLGLALSATDLGDWSLDIRSGLLSFSEAAAQIFGIRPGQPMTRSAFAALLEPEDRAGFDAALDEALASGSRYDVQYRIRRADGVRRVAVCGIVHHSTDAAVVPGMFGVVQDVTLSRQMEIDLRERAAQLADADQRKDEFLATLAHELRNPLAPLRTSLEVLRRTELGAEVREHARSIMARQVTQMARLVDELIDISRISSGKIELQKERTSLASIIDGAIEIAQPAIEQGRHRLSVSLPDGPVALLIDRTRTAQVLSNLLNNAAKYTPPDGEIELRARVESQTLVIAVRDSGIGIAPDMLSRIFDMFVQGERNTLQSQGGLGVGLTLARRLVELHDGTLEAGSSGLGNGSEFIVRLPVLLDAVEAVQPTPAPLQAGSRRRRVLVVDDNVDSAASMAMILEAEGHDVQIAHDGLAALEAVQRHAPQVVLLDIGLPGLDGYQVAERIRQGDPARAITLIAATGWGQEKDREKSDRAGFDLHLVKPLDPEMVIRRVAESPLIDGGVAPEAATALPASLAPEPTGLPGRASRLKVLVVDDSPLMLEAASAILETEGYEVRTAADGLAALQVVDEWAPRIVMLDVHMPRLNGIETARRLRVDHPRSVLGLLMMSGVTLDQSWLSHARAAGFDDCLDKSADPAVWLESLQRLALSLANP